jgi:hypothetical protein
MPRSSSRSTRREARSGTTWAASPRGTKTIGTLWKHGLINEELLFDWLYVGGMWERLKPILVAMRETSPQLWENFESMAEAQAARA